MKAYLIDFENVNSKGLTGIEKLESDDCVYIFYSDNSDTISFDMHRMVMKSKAKIEYVKVTVGGKNALDFQLSTFLGYLEAKSEYSHIFVISGDKGFDFLNNFWAENKPGKSSSMVYRTKTIMAAINYANSSSSNSANSEYENLEYSAPDIPTDSINDAVDNEAENIMEEVVSSAEFNEGSIDLSDEENEEKIYNIDKSKSYTNNVRNLMKDYTKDIKNINLVSCLLMQSKNKTDFEKSLKKHFGEESSKIYKRFESNYKALKQIRNEEKKKTNESKNLQKNNQNVQTMHKIISSDVAKVLKEFCSDEEIKYVSEQIDTALTKQQLYIRMIKAFKREKGLKVYGAVKNEYIAVHAAKEEK